MIGTARSEFTYDGLDRRVRIVEKQNGSTVRDARFIWSGSTILEERLSTGEISRFFEDGEQHDGVARYLTRDHLSSIREVTDSSGAVVTRNEYDSYGRLTRVTGTVDSRFGFTGHYTQSPSGLTLTHYRAYDPALGRWVSEDPIGLAGGLNLQQYVLSNPVSYLDPNGLDATAGVMTGVMGGARAGGFVGGPWGAVVGGVIGGLIVGGIGAYTYYRQKQTEDELTRERKFEEDHNKTKAQRERSKNNYRDDPAEAPDATDRLKDIEDAQSRRRPHIENTGKSKQRARKSWKDMC